MFSGLCKWNNHPQNSHLHFRYLKFLVTLVFFSGASEQSQRSQARCMLQKCNCCYRLHAVFFCWWTFGNGRILNCNLLYVLLYCIILDYIIFCSIRLYIARTVSTIHIMILTILFIMSVHARIHVCILYLIRHVRTYRNRTSIDRFMYTFAEEKGVYVNRWSYGYACGSMYPSLSISIISIIVCTAYWHPICLKWKHESVRTIS